MNSPIQTKSFVYAIDCPDAVALAEFYARLLGWNSVPGPHADWVDVVPPEHEARGFSIACQQIDNYRAPDWPEGPAPQQAHLDLYVSSVRESALLAESAGATKHPHQPSEDGTFIVFLDPAGHPFCLCEN